MSRWHPGGADERSTDFGGSLGGAIAGMTPLATASARVAVVLFAPA